MKKETLYIWIIALLVLVNAVQISTFLFKPKQPRPPRHEQDQDFRARVVDMLKLSEVQSEQFYKLADKHATKINALNKKEKSLTAAYFANPTELGLDSLLKIQSKKIEITQEHFNDIEEIITEEQIPNFENFKKEAIKHIIR